MSDNRTSNTVPMFVPLSGVRDPHYAEIYSNNIKIAYNPTDISIIFGVVDNLPTLQAIVRDVATVRIAPVQLKVIAQSLSMHLRAWEKYFGEIRLPEGYGPDEAVVTQSYENMVAALKARKPSA